MTFDVSKAMISLKPAHKAKPQKLWLNAAPSRARWGAAPPWQEGCDSAGCGTATQSGP